MLTDDLESDDIAGLCAFVREILRIDRCAGIDYSAVIVVGRNATCDYDF